MPLLRADDPAAAWATPAAGDGCEPLSPLDDDDPAAAWATPAAGDGCEPLPPLRVMISGRGLGYTGGGRMDVNRCRHCVSMIFGRGRGYTAGGRWM